jgi:hypothetical protein
MGAVRRSLRLLLDEAAELERPAADREGSFSVWPGDVQQQIRQARLERQVVGEDERNDRSRVARRFLAAHARRRARRDGQRRGIERGQGIDLARVVLDGDLDEDVLPQRDLLGSDLDVESEGRRFRQRRRRSEQERHHAERLRERARKSAASGAT